MAYFKIYSEKFFRAADHVNDHRAISRDGWGVDHGYTGISFSSPSKKTDFSIEQQKHTLVKKTKKKRKKKYYNVRATEESEEEKITGATTEELNIQEQKLLEKIRVAYKELKNVREGGVEQEEVGNDRAIIVSYHLPFSLTRSRLEECWTATPNHTAGFGVNALEQVNFQWTYIGWPGVEIQPNEQTGFRNQLLQENDYSPVFLKDDVEQLCRDFCYRILHPILHSTSLTTDFQMQIHDVDVDGNNYLLEEKMWTAYAKVMQHFADAVKEMFEDGDVIWLHGYHLMYLPKLIRQILPNCTIGYSLLAPFPTSELFRLLPRREELLHGLLSCDLLGFQSHGHARHFSSTCMRILGLTFTTSTINYFGQNVNIHILPMGVDLKATTIMQRKQSVKSRAMDLKKMFEGDFIFLSVGKPDLDGGIMHGLFGYEEFLKQFNPARNKRVIFVQISLVSTISEREEGRSTYRRDLQIESSISRVVGRINSKFAVMGSRGPVYYLQYDPEIMGMDELYALYEISDCILSTPLRGGLTLVPAQYMLCRHGRKRTGTVVISEFTASAEGMSGALRVNPFDTEGISKALKFALNLSEESRAKRSKQIISFVKLYTAHHYLKKFSTGLFKLASRRKAPDYMRKLDPSDLTQFYLPSKKKIIMSATTINSPSGSTKLKQTTNATVTNTLSPSHIPPVTPPLTPNISPEVHLSTISLGLKYTRVIILDYEGVLVEPKSLAELEIVNSEVTNVLKAYGDDQATELFIFSNRKKEWMDTRFKGINCSIAAEGGFYVSWASNCANKADNCLQNDRHENGDDDTKRVWERQAPRDARSGWIEQFKPIFEYFTTRTPGSFIVETENTLAWQYKDADLEHGERNSLSLQSALLEIIVGWRVRLVKRTHCIELRLFGVVKKSIVEQFCNRVRHNVPYACPALLCILSGENKGDTSVFRYLKQEFPKLWKGTTSSQSPTTVANSDSKQARSPIENQTTLNLSPNPPNQQTQHRNRGLPNIRCTIDLKESEANYYVDKQVDVNNLLLSCM
jgi:trehalose 6-phosphate synthase/phosphatase